LDYSEDAKTFLLSRGSSPDQWERHSIGYISGLFEPSIDLDPKHSDECSPENASSCETCRYLKWSSKWSSETNGYVPGLRIMNSIVYPISTYSGDIIGFQTRSIREKIYDTFVINYRPESFFFGLKYNIGKIYSRGYVALVEGPSDLLTLERFTDIPVLALSTNSTNDLQNRFLKRFVKRVYLFLDNDRAGKDGASKIRQKLEPDIEVVSVDYKYRSVQAKDINELWSILQDDAFQKHIKSVTSSL